MAAKDMGGEEDDFNILEEFAGDRQHETNFVNNPQDPNYK